MAEIQYSDRSVSVEQPNEKRSTVVVYARPGDIVNLGFTIDDGKLSFVSSDIVFTFDDGSQVVIASMGSLAFTENPPKMYDATGTLIDLEQILRKVEQIEVKDALLILTTNEEFTLVELEEEVDEIVSASDAEDEGVGGSPDDGGGPLKLETRGHVADIYDPLGEIDDYETLSGVGPASVSDGDSEYPFNSEEEYSLPGEIPLPKKKSIEVVYYYGDEANKRDEPVDINGGSYEYYNFVSTGGYSEDPLVQVTPVSFDINTNQAVFFNARYEGNQVNRNFTIKYKTVTPTQIRISGLPDVVSVSLIDDSSAVLSQKEDSEGHNVWYFDNIVSYKKLELQMNFAQGISYNNRAITIEVDYYDSDEGKADTIEFKQVVSFKPVKNAEELESTSATILSTTPPGVNVNIENGDFSDIVVGGGAGNEIRSAGGDDYVFSNIGDDKIYLGLGSDVYFASSGTDYVAGGGGNDIAYYDNNKDNEVAIDDPSDYLGDAYDTFTNQGSVDGYIGYLNYYSLLAEYGVSLDSDFPQIEETDVLFFSGGVQVYKNFEEFHLSQGNDRIFVNDDLIDDSVNGGEGYIIDTGSYGYNGVDSLYFSDAENGITVDLPSNMVIYGESGEGKITGVSGFDLVEGTKESDTFNVSLMGVMEDSITLVGGAGEDTIVGVSATALEFNFVDSSIKGKGSVINKVIYFDEVEKFIGSDKNDVFYGSSSSVSYILDGSDGDDILSYEKAYQGVTFNLKDGQVYKTVSFTDVDDLESKNHDQFSNFEEVRVSNRGDVFVLSDEGQVVSSVDGLGGDDQVNASFVAGSVTFTLGGSKVIDGKNVTGVVDYGSGSLDFIDVETLIGTDEDDTFAVNLKNTDETSFSFYGEEGTDVLTFAGSDSSVRIDFTRDRVTTKASGSSTLSVLIDFDSVERFIGSDANDTFLLSDEAVALKYDLDGGGQAAGTYDVLSFEKITTGEVLTVDVFNSSITLGSESVGFVNFEGVIGTKGDDVFVGGAIAYKFDGGGGTDSIDYSLITGSITFDQDAKTVVKSDYAGADDSLSNVEVVKATSENDEFIGSYYGTLTADGSGGSDVFRYDNARNAMVFDISDTITVTKGSNVDTLTSFEVIYGGVSTDSFILSNDTVDGGVSSIELHGNANSVLNQNELDLTAFDALTINVSAFSQGAGLTNAAGVNFVLYNFYKILLSDNDDVIEFSVGDSGAYVIDGGAGDNDTADYKAISNVAIQINDKGLSVTRGVDGKDNLTGFENIVATDGNDVINFSATQEVNVNIDLLGGYDTINFVSFVGESVTFTFGADVEIEAVNSSGDPINVVFAGAEVFVGANLVDENIFNIKADIMSYSSTAAEPIIIAGQVGSSAKTIVNFDNSFSGGVELDFPNGTLVYGADTLNISFLAVTEFSLTDGDDTVINEVNSSSNYDGGVGSDTADYSGLTSSSITVDMGTGEVKKDATLTVDNYTNFEVLIGTSRDDTFKVSDTTQFTYLDGGAGEDILSFEESTVEVVYSYGTFTSGSLGSLTPSSVEILRGSNQDDVFEIKTGEGVKQFDGASGSDTIKFKGAGVEYKAEGLSVVVNDGSNDYKFDNVENIDAGDDDQTYFGSAAVNIKFDGGNGNDTINYGNVLFGVTFDFETETIKKDRKGENVDKFSNVENFYGTSYSDTFMIADSYSTTTITLDGGDGDDYLNFANVTNAKIEIDTTTDFFSTTYDLKNIEAYQFGDTDDTAIVKDESQEYKIYMSSGVDTIDYSALNDASLAITVRYDIFFGGLSVDKGGVLDSVAGADVVVGTGNDDQFYGTSDMVDMTFDGSGGNDILTYADEQYAIKVELTSGGAIINKGRSLSGKDKISNVEVLEGSNADDVFIVEGAGSSSIAIDGGLGNDFLSFEKNSTALSGDLTSLATTGYSATNFESIRGTTLDDNVEVTTDGSLPSNNIGFDGFDGTDTLTFDSSSSGNWSISLDLINHTATRSTGGSFSILNVENYNLTDEDDSIKVSQEMADDPDLYKIDGRGGSDMADFGDVDLEGKTVTMKVGSLAINGKEILKNFESYAFGKVGIIEWDISGIDASDYNINALSGGLKFNVADITVSKPDSTFSSTNFTGDVFFSTALSEFYFYGGGTNKFIATNVEEVTIYGDGVNDASKTSLDLSLVTSGVNLETTAVSKFGADGSVMRNGNTTETFEAVDEIILTSYSDNLTLTDNASLSGVVKIDGGAGEDSMAIVDGSGSGINLDLGTGGGGTPSGGAAYIVTSVEKVSLSTLDDTVWGADSGDNDLDARDGKDTINYQKNGNISVNLQISEDFGGVVKATVQKLSPSSGRDILSSFEVYELGDSDDTVSLTTTLTQDVEVYGGGGNNTFVYLGSDISSAGSPLNMSITGKGDFTVGTFSVYDFQEIDLRTVKHIDFDINLDLAKGFRLYLSEDPSANYSFSFTSSSTIVFNNVKHEFSNAAGNFVLETYIQNLDFASNDVELQLGIDQTFQNMTFASDGMIYINLQEDSVNSVNLRIDGDSTNPHANLQLNSSYNYEFGSEFTLDLTVMASIEIADSAANTAYVITSDPSKLPLSRVNYSLEYGTNMSGLTFEDKQYNIQYGAISLALGNVDVNVTTTGDVNFAFGSDMDASTYQFRRYNISSSSSFASFNLSADTMSQFVQKSGNFSIAVGMIPPSSGTGSGQYILNIYEEANGNEVLQFSISGANAFNFNPGSSQDVNVAGTVTNFTLNIDAPTMGAGGELIYVITGSAPTLTYAVDTFAWVDTTRGNSVVFVGNTILDASGMSGDTLNLEVQFGPSPTGNITHIEGLEDKNLNFSVVSSATIDLAFYSQIMEVSQGAIIQSFAVDINSLNSINIDANIGKSMLSTDFLLSLSTNITINQSAAINVEFTGSSATPTFFSMGIGNGGLQLINDTGYMMDFKSAAGVDMVVIDNSDARFDLNIQGSDYGDGMVEIKSIDSIENDSSKHGAKLTSLTIDQGVHIFLQSRKDDKQMTIRNNSSGDEIRVSNALWHDDGVRTSINLSAEPDTLEFAYIGYTTEQISSIDFGDSTLATEDKIVIQQVVGGTLDLQVVVDSNFATTVTRLDDDTGAEYITANFGVINSLIVDHSGLSTKGKFSYTFKGIPDAGVGDLEFRINSPLNINPSRDSDYSKARGDFSSILDMTSMNVEIVQESDGNYRNTITANDGTKSNVILDNVSVFYYAPNTDSSQNNSVYQGDVENNYVFDNYLSSTAFDYNFDSSEMSIRLVTAQTVKKTPTSGGGTSWDYIITNGGAINTFLHDHFNLDLSLQRESTVIVLTEGDSFPFTDVRATAYDDILMIDSKMYGVFTGEDRYAVFDMSGGNDTLLVDGIDNDLYLGRTSSTFRNLDVHNAMSVEEGGRGVFVNSVETVSFDTKYADVYIGAYAQGFNFVSEESTTVFIESEQMDVSFEFVNGAVVSFEELDSNQTFIFSAENDNYSFNGQNLQVEGEFDLVGTRGDDIFEINGDNISELQSIDGLDGANTLDISGNIHSANQFSDKVTNINRLVFDDMETNSLDLSIEDILQIKGNQEELLIDVRDEDFNINIVGDTSGYSYALTRNGEYETYTLFDANSQEIGKVVVNGNAGLDEDGIYMQGSDNSEELTLTAQELDETALIDGGEGFDTLEISGSIADMGVVVDKVDNIEKIVVKDVEETRADLSIEDAMGMTDDKNTLVVDIEDEDFDLNIINDGSEYSYSVKSDDKYDVYTVYSDEEQKDEVGQIIVNHNNNNGSHH